MAVRTANAVWQGTLREGKGQMSFGSGAFEGAYSFASRFEEGTGTNPEELLGAWLPEIARRATELRELRELRERAAQHRATVALLAGKDPDELAVALVETTRTALGADVALYFAPGTAGRLEQRAESPSAVARRRSAVAVVAGGTRSA